MNKYTIFDSKKDRKRALFIIRSNFVGDTKFELMQKLTVVKIGGNIVDHPEKLDTFLEKFSKLNGPKVLVHGGGKIATQVSKALGIEAQMIDGRRVTDAETVKVVTMVYAGLVNKTVVSKLQALQQNAIGFSLSLIHI